MPAANSARWLPLSTWGLPAVWCVAAICLLSYTAPPFSDHPDTIRDLLAARDCADDGHCVAGGAQASFGHLRSGALWPATLAGLRAAGAPTEAVHWLVIGADAVAVALAAALAGPMAAGTLAVALMLMTREHLVWSPALMPLVAMLVAAAWRTARRRQRATDWLLLGLAFGVQADLHPVGLVFSGTALLVALGTAGAPLPALATVSGFACALGILQPEVAVLNLEALVLQRLWPVVAAAALPLVALALALRRHSRKPPPQIVGTPSALFRATRLVADPATIPALSAAIASLIVLAAASLHSAELQPRYFLAAAPPIALVFGQFPLYRAGRVAALALPIAVAAMLGPAEIGVGHPWAVVRALAGKIGQGGLAWPAYLYRLQSPGCRRLDAAVNVELSVEWTPTLAESKGWQLVDLAPGVAPKGPGWHPAADWTQGRRPMRTWIRTFEPWLRRTEGTVCVTGAQSPHTCEPLRPGARLDRQGQPTAPKADLAAIPWHMRTFPAATSLSPGTTSSQTVLQMAIHASAAGRRTLQVLDLPDRRCPWQIRAVHGLQAKLKLDGSTAELEAIGPADGTLELARSWGPGCDDPTEWQYGPPCLREDEVAP